MDLATPFARFGVTLVGMGIPILRVIGDEPSDSVA